MDWHIEAEYTGTLDDDQLELAAEGSTITEYDHTTGTLTTQTRIAADNYSEALKQAQAWIEQTCAQTLAEDGPLTGPHMMLVETADSRSRRSDLIGSAEIAARLGVSTARVRELVQRPDFPRPALNLAGGRIWRAADVDTFARTWQRKPGRPAKTSQQ